VFFLKFVAGMALLSASALFAQAAYTAGRAGDLQLGAEFVLGQSKYLPVQTVSGSFIDPVVLSQRVKLKGFGSYATFDWREHYGVELNIRHVKGNLNDGQSETTYEFGGRYVIARKYRMAPYAKAMIGRGVYNYPDSAGSLAFNLYALGAGVDFHATSSINVRAEYEYQSWLSVPIQNPQPQIVSIGVAYRFH
jgi:opacity protein-like surface antigen